MVTLSFLVMSFSPTLSSWIHGGKSFTSERMNADHRNLEDNNPDHRRELAKASTHVVSQSRSETRNTPWWHLDIWADPWWEGDESNKAHN